MMTLSAKHDEFPAGIDADMCTLLERAGIVPAETRMHPEHGLLLSPSAVRKLVAIVPDQSRAAAFIAQAEAFLLDTCGVGQAVA